MSNIYILLFHYANIYSSTLSARESEKQNAGSMRRYRLATGLSPSQSRQPVCTESPQQRSYLTSVDVLLRQRSRVVRSFGRFGGAARQYARRLGKNKKSCLGAADCLHNASRCKSPSLAFGRGRYPCRVSQFVFLTMCE